MRNRLTDSTERIQAASGNEKRSIHFGIVDFVGRSSVTVCLNRAQL